MPESAGELEHGLFSRILHTVTEFYFYMWSFFFTAECISQAKLHNKIVVITGGNTGIGKETALDLAKRGAKVIIGCRDTEKGKNAAEDIRKQVQEANVIVKYLDLASFLSIRQFASEILKSEPRIHILINNAVGKIHFDDINMDRGYNRILAYGNSKLANMLFTRELAKRLEGTGVTAYCLHPGVVDTELSRHLNSLAFGIIEFLRVTFRKLILKSPRQGAQTTIHCAVDEKVTHESGLYYCVCRLVKPLPKATDDITAEKLWKLSEYFTNFHAFRPTAPAS